MTYHPAGTIAVIFVAQLSGEDEAGYVDAAARMETLVRQQSGFVDMDSTRNEGGLGITISYWRDEASAKAWRDNPKHTEIREQGRGIWYSQYQVHVAQISRSYDWASS